MPAQPALAQPATPAPCNIREPHHSQIQVRDTKGQWTTMGSLDLHPRYWTIAVRLGRAHPDIAKKVIEGSDRLVSVDEILAHANQWISARATWRYFHGQNMGRVRLFGQIFPTTVQRPDSWPSGAYWPYVLRTTTTLVPAQRSAPESTRTLKVPAGAGSSSDTNAARS